MVTCFYHPKDPAAMACKRCMIPICDACQDERYCPECLKFVKYMRTGVSGARPAGLVQDDNKRRGSITRQLMINRLADSVLEDSTPRRGPARKPDRPTPRGSMSPNLAVVAGAVALVGAFALGALTSHRPALASAAAQAPSQPAAQAPAAPAAAPAGNVWSSGRQPDAVPPVDRTDFQSPARPAEAPAQAIVQPVVQQVVAQPVSPQLAPAQVNYIPVTSQSGWVQADSRPAPASVPRHAPIPVARRLDLPPQSAWIPVGQRAQASRPSAAAPAPSVALTYPVAGDTLSLTSYVKIAVSHPDRVSVVSVAVDGKVVGKVDSVRGRTELPIDTTAISNGNHQLQVLAMTSSGQLITAAAVPISVLN